MRYSTSYTFHGPFRILTIILFPRNSFKSRPLIPRSESRKGKYHFDFPLRFQLCNNNCVILTKTQHTREAKKILARLNIFQNAHIRGLCWFTIVWTKKEFRINYPVPGMIRKWLRTTGRRGRRERRKKENSIISRASEKKGRPASFHGSNAKEN